jgi:predicted Zn-dependent protease/uncharacterized low-complexity protein
LLFWVSVPSASAPSAEPSSKAPVERGYAKQAKAGRGKAGRGKAGRGKAGRGKAGRGKAGRGKAGRGKGGKSKLRTDDRGSGLANPEGALTFSGSLSTLSIMLSRGRYRQAIMQVRKSLNESPLDADLHAALAVCCSEFGDYGCAQSSIDMAMGSTSLPMQLVVAEADTLRHLGDPAGAAEVRRSSVVANIRPRRELAQLVRLFGDHEQNDDLEGMWEVALETIAVQEESATGYALLALTYAHMGEFDEAESWIWVGKLQSSESIALIVAEAEILTARGEARAAIAVTDAVRSKVLRNRSLATVRGAALLAAGDIDKVVVMLDLRNWYLSDELWHPDLLALQAVAFAHSGWEAPALAQIVRLEGTYARYPLAVEAAKEARRVLSGSAP